MFSGYKTYIAGALTILGALGGFLTGNLAAGQAINLVEIGRASCRERV